MFKNYLPFKASWRNLFWNKSFSLIEYQTGLAIGMASAVLILLWIQNELELGDLFGFHSKERPHPSTLQTALYTEEMWNAGQARPSALRHCATISRLPAQVEEAVRVNWVRRFCAGFHIGDVLPETKKVISQTMPFTGVLRLSIGRG